MQWLVGGWWYPALAMPGYLLVGVAAVLAGVLAWRAAEAPGAWCTGVMLAFAGYVLWRQLDSTDAFAARDDLWLVLGALAVYLTVAWQLRDEVDRGLLLGLLFALMVVQVLVAAAQFTAAAPFHPLAAVARVMDLPTGEEAIPNHGWVTGTLHARTALSGVLEGGTFLALGLLVWGRGGIAVKLLLLWVTAAGFAGMVICLSRSAYLGLPAGVIVFCLVSFFVVRRGAVTHRFLWGAGLLAVVGLSLGLGFLAGWESFAVRFRVAELAVDAYRMDLWSITVPPMLALDPWFGTGAGTFEGLARRYNGGGFVADPIHAHSDWLELLIEYGWIGLLLGAAFFVVHFGAGWRNALRLAREERGLGPYMLPQNTDLGLATGGLAAMAALGMHAVFDYSLHVPAVGLMAALVTGFVAAARPAARRGWPAPLPGWLRVLAVMPLFPGLWLASWMAGSWRAEYATVAAENALKQRDNAALAVATTAGLYAHPGHPRLLWLAGLSAHREAVRLSAEDLRAAWPVYGESAGFLRAARRQRPDEVFTLLELSRTLDLGAYAARLVAASTPDPVEAARLQEESDAWFAEARAVHLRAIGRDPDYATAYEGLVRHLVLQQRLEEAERLGRWAAQKQGSRGVVRSLGHIEDLRQKDATSAGRGE